MYSEGFYSLKTSIIIVKNKVSYFAVLTYCGLFLERNSRDKRGATVLVFARYCVKLQPAHS